MGRGYRAPIRPKKLTAQNCGPRIACQSCMIELVRAAACAREGYVNPRQSPASHQVRVRSPGRAWASDHQATAGAPFAHGDRQLFTQGDADRTLRQLAAGPERKLERALRLP